LASKFKIENDNELITRITRISMRIRCRC